MVNHEDKNKRDNIEVSLVLAFSGLIFLFGWGFVFLYNSKLDRAVFEEHNRAIANMSDDIRAIRTVMDQHAIREHPIRGR